MKKSPTLSDIRKTNLDDTLFGKYFYRFLATYLTFGLARTSLTPNQVSMLSLFFTLLAALFFGFGTYPFIVLAIIFLQIGMILDYCDGQIARLKKLGTKRGAWFDVILGMIQNNLLVFGIIIGLTHVLPQQSLTVWLVGSTTLFAWNMTCYVHLVAMIFFPRMELKQTKLASRVRKFSIKPQYLSIGSDVYFVLFGVFGLFNQLFIVLWILSIIGNLYWIAVFFYFFFSTKHVK